MKRIIVFFLALLIYGAVFAQNTVDSSFYIVNESVKHNYNNSYSTKAIETVINKLPDPLDPKDFGAHAISGTQINLSWIKNSDNDDVILAYSTYEDFGNPTYAVSYDIGDLLTNGGEVLYYGSAEAYNHSDLDTGTIYYYKVWSIKDITPIYSNGISTSESTYGPPTLSKPIVSDINLNSVLVKSLVLNENGSIITEKGFVYSLISDPTIDDNKIEVEINSTFLSEIIELNESSQYFIKSFAINSFGIGYSDQTIFTTENITRLHDINTEKFNIYPNPTSGQFTVSMPFALKLAEISIFDIKGTILLKKKLYSPNSEIDISNIPVGIYFLQINSPNMTFQYKISKN